MQPPESSVRSWYQKPLIWIILGILVCAGFLSMPYVRRIYHRWTGEKKVQRAKEALARKDFDAAILNARGALATNAKDIEATRLMAQTAEALGAVSQTIQFRRQLDAIQPGDPENLLALADAYLKSGDANAADEALKSVPEADRKTARYHNLASSVAWARRDLASSELHLVEAAKLAPQDDSYQLRLATFRLESKSPELRQEALNKLQTLGSTSATRVAALRTLLTDTLARLDSDRSLELAAALVACPDATFADRLAQLSTLNSLKRADPATLNGMRRVSESDFSVLLAKLQEVAAEKPEDLFTMLTWMNENFLALFAAEWIEKIPAEATTKPPVCFAVADSYALGSNWKKLKDVVEPANWGQFEFLRLAYISRSLDRLGDDGAAAVAWNRALEVAQDQPGSLERLARETRKWGWDQKTQEALWKLATKDRCPRWGIDFLWTTALRKQDTDSLCRVSKLILEAEPKSVAARNNFISLSLLTGRDEDSPHRLAEAHYRENPENADVASTYGFSLYKQGDAEQAVKVMSQLTPEQLRQPPIALSFGIFLAATGEPDKAEEHLRIGSKAILLPEQKGMADTLGLVFQTKTAEQSGDREKAEATWKKALAVAENRTDRLEMLGRIANKWGWQGRAQEAVMKLATLGNCPPWAADLAWAALRNVDSAQRYKISKAIFTANPRSAPARVNLIVLALLARNEAENPHLLAESLHEENPTDAEATGIYCFSLLRQSRLEQALAIVRTVPEEKLRQPRAAFYSAVILAAAGDIDQAKDSLNFVSAAQLLPEEQAIEGALRFALQWGDLKQSGALPEADAVWAKALSSAQNEPELLETLGRMALKNAAPERANEALWRRTELPGCPRWALDHLWEAAERNRDSGPLYKAAALLRRANPSDTAAQNNFIRLSLLTGRDADFPHRLAETLYRENPGNADVAATYSLSLYQRNKAREAAALLGALKAEVLRTPRTALSYGICLAAAGEATKAQEYLEIAARSELLPEERALLVTRK